MCSLKVCGTIFCSRRWKCDQDKKRSRSSCHRPNRFRWYVLLDSVSEKRVQSGTVTQEKAPNGMLEHVGVKPGGDEKKSVSMEKDHAMESLPTGLSTSPREQPSFEETPERIDASQKDDE